MSLDMSGVAISPPIYLTYLSHLTITRMYHRTTRGKEWLRVNEKISLSALSQITKNPILGKKKKKKQSGGA